MSEISLENEGFIDELISSGRFPNRADVLDEAVRLLRAEFPDNGRKLWDTLSATDWCNRFEKWAASHRILPQEADDSRESIYPRRERVQYNR